ncbi:MAG: efflux RND transporter periplasmic adaptor subunit [Mucilaginibacter sp.]|uniref:efflux RND transporter periplasmic adaptor subunit n=1 Tax=Mucilaginibacter sp. TaxID=1882438 RepID=UPI0034E5F643
MKINYIIILTLLLLGCGNSSDKKDQSEPQQQQPKEKNNSIAFDSAQIKNGGIDTGRLSMHPLSGFVQVNGQVDVPPENLISVNVPLGGFLKQTAMLPGEPVHKGQVLATVENQDYITIQQDYLTSTSRMVFLKQEMVRQRELSQQQASPLKLYQQSQADYNSEQAQAAGLAQKLRMLGINPQRLSASSIKPYITIFSPISGYISKVDVNIGKYINPNDELMQLVNTSDIHAALTVFEQDISKIKIGNKVKITLPSIPGQTFPGKIILIGRMLDSSRSVMVHCHFLKTDPRLLPNMFLQASIETKPQNTMAVPDGALINFGGKPFIFAAKPQPKNAMLFSMIPVEIGIQENGWNEIRLKKPELANQLFVLKGAFSILSAMKNTGEED